MDDDHFNSSRVNEEALFQIVRSPQVDGSEYLNDSGEGMDEERRDEAQTSFEGDADAMIGGNELEVHRRASQTRSGEVY